jgi:hypothetical protein
LYVYRIICNPDYKNESVEFLSIEDIARKIFDLLQLGQFSNDCFQGVQEKMYSNFLKNQKVHEKQSEMEELDIGRPIIFHRMSNQKVLNDQFRILSEILDSNDFLAKNTLLKNGLVDTLSSLRYCDDQNKIQMLNLLTKISCSKDLENYLLTRKFLYIAINGLKDSSQGSVV